MSHKNRPELVQYLHAALFSSITEILLNSIKQGLLKTWTGLTSNLIKKHLEKSSNTKTGHLHMIIKRLKSTREKPQDTDLEENSKTNVLFFYNRGPWHNERGWILLRYMWTLPHNIMQRK